MLTILERSTQDGGGRGMAAAEDIPFDTELCFIPRDPSQGSFVAPSGEHHALWTADRVLQIDSALRRGIELAVRNSGDVSASESAVNSCEFALCAAVLRARHGSLGVEEGSECLRDLCRFSMSLPAVIPSVLDCEVELRAIGATFRADKVHRMNHRKHAAWEELDRSVFSATRDVFPEEVFTFERWTWADRVLASRAFHGPFAMTTSGVTRNGRLPVGRLRPNQRLSMMGRQVHKDAENESSIAAGTTSEKAAEAVAAAVVSDDGSALIPFVEYFNHASAVGQTEAPSNSVSTRKAPPRIAHFWFDEERDGLIVCSPSAPLSDEGDEGRGVPICWAMKGEELYLHYTHMSHWRFAKYYGFVPTTRTPNTSHTGDVDSGLDEVPLKVPPPPVTVTASASTPQQEAIHCVLKAAGLLDNEERFFSAGCSITEAGPNEKLMAALRIKAMETTEDLVQFPQSQFGLRQLNIHNEIRALSLCSQLVQTQLGDTSQTRTQDDNAVCRSREEGWKTSLARQVKDRDDSVIGACNRWLTSKLQALTVECLTAPASSSLMQTRPASRAAEAVSASNASRAGGASARDRFKAMSAKLLE